MKEIARIVSQYDKLDLDETKVALATVIDVKGSSYRRTGARMLIEDTGTWTGGISGGCIEGDALKRANLAMLKKEAMLVTYDTAKDSGAEIGVSLGCNGVITVLIAPVNPSDKSNPIEVLRTCLPTREPKVLITVVAANSKTLTAGRVVKYIDGRTLSEALGELYDPLIASDVERVLATGNSLLQNYATCKLFLEFVPPAMQLIIMGSNYDTYPLLRLASEIGWQTVVVANPNRVANDIYQQASQVAGNLQEVAIDDYTVAILMAHDYHQDLDNLATALGTNLRYIGLLGPAGRRRDLLADLPFSVSEAQQQRLYGPSGLDIGARQPEEIALAIIAEMLAVMRQRHGGSLKYRQQPIYD